MGFLGLGEPYDWFESREEAIAYVREHGIEQFITMWEKVKGIDNDTLKWGDEIEYHIFKHDAEAGTVQCSLRGAEILEMLNRNEKLLTGSASHTCANVDSTCAWVPEYGAWMVEGTPAQPYAGLASDLLRVEKNMRKRRAKLLHVLNPDEICPTVPCFPLLGVGEFTSPAAPPGGPVTESLFIPDAAINPHPRFAALTGNIRKRRGRKIDIRMPRFMDTKTPRPISAPGAPAPTCVAEADGMAEVYMDAMAFGMGCCCLQVTFQAREVTESRHLYDQLAVVAPLFVALTAATPAARGALLDTDSRWDIISQSVDDRTPAELGRPEGEGSGSVGKSAGTSKAMYHPNMAGGGKEPQLKSRYAGISLYICEELTRKDQACSSALNDISAPYDEIAFARLQAAGIDAVLARHVAHLFSRDPLVIFRGRTSEIADADSTEHFENLQSTNWQTVRWKPPPASSKALGGDADIGWRVEFRTMEVQLTDFENAAFTVFIVLLSRVILYFDLNLYLPMSKVDENLKRAQGQDAVLKSTFWFSQSLMPVCTDCPGKEAHARGAFGAHKARKLNRSAVADLFGAGEVSAREMSILEILQGSGGNSQGTYRGLVPMILAYLDVIGTDSITLRQVSTYLDFIVARAAGELMTPAAWMRNYIRTHPDYKFDSVVSSRIATDLMAKCHRIGQGLEKVPELHGHFHIEPVAAKDAFPAELVSNIPSQRSASFMGRAVEKYAQRAELMSKKRKLQGELERQRSQMAKMQSTLAEVEAELSNLNGNGSPTPFKDNILTAEERDTLLQ